MLGQEPFSLDEVHGGFAGFNLGGITFALHGGYEGDGGETPLHIHFEVDDIHAEVKRLRARGVKFLGPVRKQPYHAYETTFVDPDGNRFDLVQAAGEGPIL